MRFKPAVLVALLATAVAPAAAVADPPWSPPATIPNAVGVATPVVFTATGQGAVATLVPTSSPGFPDTVLTAVGPNGALGHQQPLQLSSARLATYGNGGIAIAGTRTATTAAQARTAPVELGTGIPAHGVAGLRALPGTAGQQLFALAGSQGGTIALVTGTVTGHRTRVVWIRRDGKLKRALTIRVGDRARGAAVAVGSHGDVLVVWEDNHQVFSRHIGPTGHVNPAHRLGDGVQSALQARYDDSGRQEVAWMSQRVSEGNGGNATISYTSAARGHGFIKPVVVGTDSPVGTGRFVADPGVRLVGSGSDSSVLALTLFDGAHFRVAVANVAAGRVQAPQLVSPDGEDAVLGDLGYARAGGTLVLWRSGTAGHDAVGAQRVFASWRPAGEAAFGAPEGVSDPGETIAESPFGAVDPKTGAAVAAYATLAPRAAISARPAR